MLGLLKSIYSLTLRKQEIQKEIKTQNNSKKIIALENTIVSIDETIDFLMLKVNDFLVFAKSESTLLHKVIRRRYFETQSWGEATQEFYDFDYDVIRLQISRLCSRYDKMTDEEKEEYIK